MSAATTLNTEDENMVRMDNSVLVEPSSVSLEILPDDIYNLVENDDTIETIADDDGTLNDIPKETENNESITIAHGDDDILYDVTNETENNTTIDAVVFVSNITENNTTVDLVAIDDTIDQKKETNKITTITNNVNHVSGQKDNPIDINELFKSIQQMTKQFQATVDQNEKFKKDLMESKKKQEELIIQSRKDREESRKIQNELKNKYYRLETDEDIEIEVGDDALSVFLKSEKKRKLEVAGTVTTKRKVENRVYSEDDNAVYIDLPYLADGNYDWLSIVTVENRYNRHRLRVSDDYLSINQTVTREEAKKRCRFLELTIEDKNIDRVTIEMQNMRQSIRNTIKTTLYKFWIDIASPMGLRIINEPGRVIRDLDDVLFAIRTMQTQADVRKVSLLGMYIVYLVLSCWIW